MRGDSGYVHPAQPSLRNQFDSQRGPFPEDPTFVMTAAQPKCDTCKYCILNSCHRYAPTMGEATLGRWPLVGYYDWCGEWDGGAR